MSSNNGVANGHRTTVIPQLDVPAPEEFKTPITDALVASRPWKFAPPTEQELADGAAKQDEPRMHWADELRQWWNGTADRDISSSLDKIVAYGGSGAAYDLIATGHDLAAMNGRKVDDSEAIELGIAFYLSSKVNRWMAAIIDGRRPSDDTLLDIVFYGMMARRNRAVGGWPIA